ncbi:hypothetical protein DMB38_16460 [Streptomyces sp. WAC 06738]|nr:hypothetical protein DMB38_16460 [Streptomyces sp. WAC 06738]
MPSYGGGASSPWLECSVRGADGVTYRRSLVPARGRRAHRPGTAAGRARSGRGIGASPARGRRGSGAVPARGLRTVRRPVQRPGREAQTVTSPRGPAS